ncbi:uncharacterized protein [Hemitrygon akajei]|uniref:uncharacterized protein n=1 Tax=Hemitrygon akajei TaxID=2704970 RepID=UPI003BF9B2C7
MEIDHHRQVGLSCIATDVPKGRFGRDTADHQQVKLSCTVTDVPKRRFGMDTDHHQQVELSCTATDVPKIRFGMDTDHHQHVELSCIATDVPKRRFGMDTDHHQHVELSCIAIDVPKSRFGMDTEYYQQVELSCTETELSTGRFRMEAVWKLTRVRRDPKRYFPDQSSREDDRDEGNQTTKQRRIDSNVPMENGSATVEGEQSQPTDSDVRDTAPHDGTGTDPVPTRSDLLAQRDEYQLTKPYRDRLKQAIEEGVETLSWMLRKERYFSAQEHAEVAELAEKGNRAECSTLFVNLVMGKGLRTRRAMWESFAKMRTELPKLDRILKEIQELGPDPHVHIN